MKSFIKPTIASLLAMALLGAVLSAQAESTNAPAKSEKAEKSETKGKKKRETLPFHGKVQSVDTAAMTVTLDSKESKEGKRTFTVTSSTKITKNGSPASLSDITAGETVGGAYKKSAEGKLIAVSLNFDKPKTEAPKVEAPKAPAAPAATAPAPATTAPAPAATK